MGSFAADHRPVRAVDPLPADLAQRVCEPLRGRAIVFGGLRSRLGVKNRAEGGQERFAGLRVEVTVDTDHPQVRRGGVQPPPRTCRVLTPQVVSVIDLLTPEADHKLQVAIA